MQPGRTVFAQLMDHVTRFEFQTCVARYDGEYKVSRFSCWDQYLCMAFAQFTYRESLRDVEACLRALQSKLYHVGIRARVSRSTLADANETRDWRIYADFTQGLIRTARALYLDDPLAVDLANTVYALDATVIDLCLSVFPWAHYRTTDAGVKLHAQLDLRGLIPTVVQITARKRPRCRVSRRHPSSRLARSISWIVATWTSRVCIASPSKPASSSRAGNAICAISDEPRIPSTIGRDSSRIKRWSAPWPRRAPIIPRPCVACTICDPVTQHRLVFMSNNFTLPALTIAQLYKSRWQVELFFKWIKQHLRIKAFYGTSENAVKTQIWIALSVYVLVAIVRKRLALDVSLYKLLQVLSLTLFEKMPISTAVLDAGSQFDESPNRNQLQLFNL